MGKGHSHEVVHEYVQDPAILQQLEAFQRQNAYLLQEFGKLQQKLAAWEIRSFDDLQRHDQRGAEELRNVSDHGFYHMFTPSATKRDEIQRQAKNGVQKYQEHIERTSPRNLKIAGSVGGESTEEDVRKRQDEQYRREKFDRQERNHRYKLQKKQDEEREIEAKKQAARRQALLLEEQNQIMKLQKNKFLSSSQRVTINWTDNTWRQNQSVETIEQQVMTDFVSSDLDVDYFAIIYGHLFAIDSWTDEQKSNIH
ncbi:unnamed protein product [Rotaria sordida]|uniref:Uncharacterized protein n=1 Tax=Rotaria sordida TaxID=392033 RepID=A0A815PEW4_9BILA|nr:unnamed protein product [Rotaria sordida]CAF1448243.1 unnamed protein product [Rotaria sordida]